jgi:hypothetical protein
MVQSSYLSLRANHAAESPSCQIQLWHSTTVLVKMAQKESLTETKQVFAVDMN